MFAFCTLHHRGELFRREPHGDHLRWLGTTPWPTSSNPLAEFLDIVAGLGFGDPGIDFGFADLAPLDDPLTHTPIVLRILRTLFGGREALAVR